MKTDWIALRLLGQWSVELGLGSVLLRLALSLAFSAIIGCERSSKRHSAGLRTFILVSLAGTGTMLLDIYLMQQGMALPVLSAAAIIGTATISSHITVLKNLLSLKRIKNNIVLSNIEHFCSIISNRKELIPSYD